MLLPQPHCYYMKCYDKDLEVLYLDNHILALNKPPGLLTQPNNTPSSNLEDIAKAYLKKRFKKVGNVFLHPIHRLDKPVSGIVLFARTSKSLSRLNDQMRKKNIKKLYYAKVEGHVKNMQGTLKHTMMRTSFRTRCSKKGKEAVLSYNVIKNYESFTFVEVDLYTGRYHQIRAQFAEIGHPVLGDIKYGSAQKKDNIALHHGKMVFEHPVKRKQITITSKASF